MSPNTYAPQWNLPQCHSVITHKGALKMGRGSEGVAMSLLFYLVLFIATCTFGWFSRNKSG